MNMTASLPASLFVSLFFASMVPAGAALAQSASPEAASAASAGKAAASADDAAATPAATESATRWLALADAGNWNESWDQMAPASQAMVAKAAFTGAMPAVRAPLGAVKSRTLRSAVFTRSLPGAPAGDYVVIDYDTDFANKAGAIERLVPMRTPDGSWKVSGYFIR